MSDTPITDDAEHFMYFETPRVGYDYARTQRPSKNRQGFVYSEVARKLELEVQRLRDLLDAQSSNQ